MVACVTSDMGPVIKAFAAYKKDKFQIICFNPYRARRRYFSCALHLSVVFY